MIRRFRNPTLASTGIVRAYDSLETEKRFKEKRSEKEKRPEEERRKLEKEIESNK